MDEERVKKDGEDVVSTARKNFLLAQMQAEKINENNAEENNDAEFWDGEQSSVGYELEDKTLNAATLQEIDDTFVKLRLWKKEQPAIVGISKRFNFDSDTRLQEIIKNMEMNEAILSDRNDAIEDRITASNNSGARREQAVSKLREILSDDTLHESGREMLTDLSAILEQNKRLELSRQEESKQSDSNSAYLSKISFGAERGEGKENINNYEKKIGNTIRVPEKNVFTKIEGPNSNQTDYDRMQEESIKKAEEFMDDGLALSAGLDELEHNLLSFGDEIDALFEK